MSLVIRSIIAMFLFLSCRPGINKQILLFDQEIIEPNDYLEDASSYLPDDSLVSIKYKISSRRYAFGFDDRNKNKKYLAEINGYDENNNLIEHLSYRSDGHLDQHTIYIYQGGLLRSEYRFNSDNRETLYKTSYEYNAEGKISESVLMSFERRMKKRTDTADTGLKCIIVNSDFEKTKSWGDVRKTTYGYDSKNNLIEKKRTSENSPSEIETYKYNNQGRIIEELTLSRGNVSRKINTTYFTDSLESVCVFPPLESGNIFKEKFDNNGNILYETGIDIKTKKHYFARKYFYDKKNRVIKEEYITNLGTSVFTVYEYKQNKGPVHKVFAVNNE